MRQYDFSILVSGFTSSNHIPISSHELPSLPKTNMKSKGSRNVTGLKFKIVLILNLKVPNVYVEYRLSGSDSQKGFWKFF